MSKLPKQIQRQVQQADAAMVVPAPNAPEPETVSTAQADPNAAPANEPASQEAAPATPQPPAPAGDSEQTWEQRYRSLQGVHNHHVADLKQRLQQKEAALAAMHSELEAAKRAKPEAPEASSVDPKDAEVFGADLVQMVIRVAETRFMGLAARLEARVTEVEQRLNGTTKAVVQTAEEVFLSRLRAAVPDYEDVNVEAGFLTWLAEIDPVYGRPRQAALTEAAEALDASRVANIFLTYKGLRDAGRKPATARTPASELERQIAPDTGAAAPQLRQDPSQTLSSAYVTKFYRDLAAGRYRGREEEASRIESQINKALAENRIT